MDTFVTSKTFWQKRAKTYNKLQWANREDYLDAFVSMCELNKTNAVLDLGTGTGTVVFRIHDAVRQITGVDYSEAMLAEARQHNHRPNVSFVNADIRRLPFSGKQFDLITARMVFHHLLWGANRAMAEVKRLLKPGGIFCISEGVPPDRCVETFYTDVFRFKEKRRTFFPEDVVALMKAYGFTDVRSKEHWMKRCSIKNWLDNAGNLSEEVKQKIYTMHLNLHQEGKKAYTMEITPDDCFIDMKFVIVSGRK